GEGAEGMHPRAVIRRHRRDDVTDGDHAIAGLAADPQDEIGCRSCRRHAALSPPRRTANPRSPLRYAKAGDNTSSRLPRLADSMLLLWARHPCPYPSGT